MVLQLFLMIQTDAACCIAMLPLLLEQCIDPSNMHFWGSPAGKRKSLSGWPIDVASGFQDAAAAQSSERNHVETTKRMKLGGERWITGAS